MSEDVMTIFKRLKQITKNENKCFQFNWQVIANNSWEIFQMSVGSKLIGLIALEDESNYLVIQDVEIAKNERHKGYGSTMIAFAAWYSFRCKDDGYVSLTTKTNGTEKFYQKLGAHFITDQRCYFPTSVSTKLVKCYKPEGGFRIAK